MNYTKNIRKARKVAYAPINLQLAVGMMAATAAACGFLVYVVAFTLAIQNDVASLISTIPADAAYLSD